MNLRLLSGWVNGSIQHKIMVLGAVAMFIIAGVIIGYSASALYGEAFSKAEYHVDAEVLTFGGEMNAELSAPVENAETMASTIQGMYSSGNRPTREQINNLLKTVLTNNPEQFGVYTAFEPDAFDGDDAGHKGTPGADDTGRYAPYYYRGESGIALEPLKGLETDDYYQVPKKILKTTATEPYSYNVGGKDVLMASFVAPIIVDNKFIGIAGVDLSLDSLNKRAEQFSMYDGAANLLIISKGGQILGENLKNDNWVGKQASDLSLTQVGIDVAKLPAALEKAQTGASTLYTGDGFTKALVPVKIGNTGTYWDIAVTVPVDVIGREPMMKIVQLILIGLVFIIIGIGMLYLVARSISRPIEALTGMATRFAAGDVTADLVVDQQDEVGRLAVAFHDLGVSLSGKTDAATAISKGDLSIDVPVTSDQDRLGIAMVTMRDAIQQIIKEIGMIAGHSSKGDLGHRGKDDGLSGEFSSIIHGLNKTLDGIVTPVNEAMRLSGSYAIGDYTDRFSESVSVEGDFWAFKEALNQIGIQGNAAVGGVKAEIEGLTASMEETNASVEEVASTTNVLAQNANSVSELADRSGDGIRQMLDAMESLTQNVSSVASRAEQASGMAKDTVVLSEKGVDLAGKAEQGMEGIMRSAGETNTIITDITGQMEEIGKIVDVITGIAEQTGLLALNAAIEAARAGDAGLGFAVVADEVKALALESQKSAENIATIIGNLQKKSNMVSTSMKTASVEVEAGNAAVRQTLDVFRQIVDAISTVHTTMTEVAGSTEEQAAAVQEITASANEVEAMVQKTAREATDSAAATQEVTASIDQITRAISEASASIQSISSEMSRFTTN